MTTINVGLQFGMTVQEILDQAEIPSSNGSTVIHSAFNAARALNAATTPPATMRYSDELVGDQSLDLTALDDPSRGTLDASGLKLQAILINNLSTTDEVVVSPGSSNGYPINGAAGSIEVPAGGNAMVFFNDELADVDPTHKAIDIAAEAGESYQIQMIFG